MFLADRMKSTMQGVFYIANNSVYPFEFYHLNTLGTSTGYYRDMLVTVLLKSCEAFKAIGYHISPRNQMLLSPSFYRFFGKGTYLAGED